MKRFVIFFLFFLGITCKPTPEDAFDELRRTGSVFRQASFCAENPALLATRQTECDLALAQSIEGIESVLNRQMDLLLTPTILTKQTGEEIEHLLRIKTELGIRYLEIWKQSVILE
jgi:hypothetical protein